jgi:hypothetical protein
MKALVRVTFRRAASSQWSRAGLRRIVKANIVRNPEKLRHVTATTVVRGRPSLTVDAVTSIPAAQ